jgi:hypothetical protein
MLRRAATLSTIGVLALGGGVAFAPGAALRAAAASPAPATTQAPPPQPVRARPAERSSPGRADPSPGPGPRLALPSAPLPSGTWQALGPAPIGPPYLVSGGFYGGVNSGRITGLAVIASGTHAGRVVAGTAGGGAWTSDDNGTTWTPRTDQAASLAIGAVADDPTTPDHLVAGTGEANQCGDCYPGFGILASTDGGGTWSMQDPGGVFDGVKVAQLAIDPSNSAHMFAATTAGLFVTSNSGTSWSNIGGGNVTAVVIDPSTPMTVYAGTPTFGPGVVVKSIDGGVNWATADSGIAPVGSNPFIALALASSSPATLYASVGSSDNPVALYKTTNNAGSWSVVSAAPDYTGFAYSYGSSSGEQGFYDNVLAVDPSNASHVLAGGVALVETTNGGTSWTNVNGQAFFGGGTNLLHPDHHALSFRPDGKVWVGDDGGMFLYNPAGPTVTNANGNLNVTQFYFGFNEVGGTVLAGAQDNATARTNSSSLSAWTGIWTGDGGPSAITANRPATQFIQSDQDFYRTTDAFATNFTKISPPQLNKPTWPFTPPIAVAPNTADPSNPTVFYGGADLYRTTNPSSATPTWTQVTTVGTLVSALALSPSNPQVVYVGFRDGTIQVSTNAGVSFTSLATEPTAGPYTTGLSIDPTNPHAITASFSASRDTRSTLDFPHVAQYSYATAPGSGTWTIINGNLPNFAVSRVAYDNGALIAATDAGVYGTGAPSGGATAWSLVGTGLPAVQVQDLFVDPVSNDVYAVTHGRGAWRLPVGTALLRTVSSPAVPTQITVDGQVADSWGLAWVKEPPGPHTVCFAHVDGWTEPPCQNVTLSGGATTMVTGNFTQRGTLRVLNNPAVASAISVDGNPTDEYGMWTDIPTGAHTVCWGAVTGWTPPACQSVTVNAGATTTVTGNFTACGGCTGQTGVALLRVTTNPAVPSQITLQKGAGPVYIADHWGLTWLEVPGGSYTVCFSHVIGWTEPACQTVTVTNGVTTTVQGNFTQRGFLRVITSPAVAATIFVDGLPRNDWGDWTDYPTGSHMVCFGPAAGLANTPTCQTVTVNAGVETDVTGTYN